MSLRIISSLPVYESTDDDRTEAKAPIMKRSSKALLFLAGAGVGGIVGAYLVLRENREEIRRAARTTREVADRADRIAGALESLTEVLEPRR